MLIYIQSLQFHVQRPVNSTTVGTSMVFEVQLYQPEHLSMPYPTTILTVPSIAINVSLRVVNKDVNLDTTMIMKSLSFSCIFTNMFVRPGWNTYEVSLLKDNVLLQTANVHVYAQQLTDNKLDHLVAMTKARIHQHFAYLILRLGNTNDVDEEIDWTRLVSLDARRVEVITLGDEDGSNEDKSTTRDLCRMWWGASFMTHCYNQLSALYNIAFVDTSFVSFAALVSHYLHDFRPSATIKCSVMDSDSADAGNPTAATTGTIISFHISCITLNSDVSRVNTTTTTNNTTTVTTATSTSTTTTTTTATTRQRNVLNHSTTSSWIFRPTKTKPCCFTSKTVY